MGSEEGTWIAYHLFYYEDPRRAVLGVVRPAVAALLHSDLIESFFFVLYAMGGPHVRLRLLPRDGHTVQVAEKVEALAREFLVASPSALSLDPDAIRRSNETIAAGDDHESDLAVYPDDSFLPFPFRPETERYGGPERLAASLDFFAVSSAVALDFLARNEGQSRSRQLGGALAMLARQALSFALDEEELASLLRYGVESWGYEMPAIIAKADGALTEQSEAFQLLFRREFLDTHSAPPGASRLEATRWLREASRLLSRSIEREDSPARRRVGTSQLHMTANRLGLSNPEEVYLSRILSGLLAEFLSSPERTSEPNTALAETVPLSPSPSLQEILPLALANLL